MGIFVGFPCTQAFPGSSGRLSRTAWPSGMGPSRFPSTQASPLDPSPRTFHLILASASRRSRIHTQGEKSSFTGAKAPVRPPPSAPPEESQDIGSHRRLTYFRKLLLNSISQKHRYLRQFREDPDFLRGCFWLQ